MLFFCGMHQPSDAGKVPRAFVSVHRIADRRSDFAVSEWIMDSGAFSTVAMHGGYPQPPEAYCRQIDRWRTCGRMLRAVSQDYMCEPHMLQGRTVEQNQELTIERYDAIAGRCGDIVMPVLQGWHAADYARHVTDYGTRLAPGMWVGVGSVCKRQGRPGAIAEVLSAILGVRPDLRLHGFGVKTTSLADGAVVDRLYSADSMAWSFAARRQGRNGNDWREAARFAARMESMPVQGSLL